METGTTAVMTAPTEGAGSSHDGAFCLFRSGSRPCAVPLSAVVEVVRGDRLTRLPGSSPALAGLCILRRDVLPVFRPAEGRGAAEPPSLAGKSFVLVLACSRGNWGLLIDPEGILVHGEGSVAAAREVIHDKTAYALIDPEEAWRELRASMEAWYGARPSAG